MPFPDPATPSPRRHRRRLTAAVLGAVFLGVAGAGAWVTATRGADLIEAATTRSLRDALAAPELGWATASVSGLTVTLAGTAPDEAARLRAMTAASGVVAPARITDRIAIAGAAAAPAPQLRLELFRNDAELTMTGSVASTAEHDRIAAAVARLADRQGAVTDLITVTETTAAPAGWTEALALGTEAIRAAPDAKVSVTPGRVAVAALAASAEDKLRIEAELNRARPEGVALDLTITAPRPVISPFTLRFVRDPAGARFDACAADSEAARAMILDAARAAGLHAAADCTLALGVPSPDWGAAVAAALAAVGSIGAGQVTFTDAAVALEAPASVPQPDFDAAADRLRGALPTAFRLTAERAQPPAPVVAPAEARFTAVVAAGGRATLQGPVADERMRNAVESLARARFPLLEANLTTDPGLPEGWTVRVIAGIEAMAGLQSGSVEVTPDMISIAGVSGDGTASGEAAQALGRRLGAGADYRLAIRYDRRLDPALALPDGEQCADRANAVMATAEIGFDPGGATIAGDVAPTMAALRDALRECGAFRLEVGGHTDAQGSEGGNLSLSRQRAQAVLAAMAAAGIDMANLTAAGYGESRPVASNDTDAGREANRRIEFRLVAPEPVEAPAAAATPVAGVTAAAPTDTAARPPLGPDPALSEVPAELAPPAPATPPGAPAAEDAAELSFPAAGAQPASGVADQRPVAIGPYAAGRFGAAGLAAPGADSYIDAGAAPPGGPAD